jgi:hypothetical protein
LQGWDCRISVTIVTFIVKLVIVTVVVLGAGDIGDLRDEGIAATLGIAWKALLSLGTHLAKKPVTPLKQWTLSAVDYTPISKDGSEREFVKGCDFTLLSW